MLNVQPFIADKGHQQQPTLRSMSGKNLSGKQREGFRCASARARDFSKVHFFKNEKADEEMQKNLVAPCFNNKVEGQKKQKEVAGREVDLKIMLMKTCV